jgi:predicted nucleic acid-binding protein
MHEGPCLVLMDELSGRLYARAHGLSVTGLAGVLLAAKKARLVESVRPFFDRLEKSNFRLSEAIVRAILEQAGEAELPT